MSDNTYNNKKLVFGLDIGTRSIVGSVGYMESNNKFNVVAHYSKEHDTRAMLDGQIHDIGKVSDTISKVKKELEMQLKLPLNEVCIAAAGRVLRTLTVHVDYEFKEDTAITEEQIYSLDTLGIEKAYEEIRSSESEINYYCVGYTVVKYYLNDFVIGNLEGHKARKISADILATFLPEDVVTGLYTSVENAELSVANLTLEPIAAINIAIPEKYRLLNIALVDVGAGTSDISITKEGSIIAYGMIPRAGDEITESIVSRYLVEFNTAEKIKRASTMKKQITFKDIMGLKQKIALADAQKVYADTVESITREIAEKIKSLNGGRSVSAVFVVGGGGKAVGFTENLAKFLDIPEERVALRGAEVLTEVNFLQEGIKKDPLLVTPIGICLSYYDHKNNFVFVNINGERIKLYDNDKLTVMDAAFQISFPNEALFARRGKALEFTVNGEKRMVRGLSGESAVITVNGKEGNINTKISKNDKIVIRESTAGKDASLLISQLPEYASSIDFVINGQKMTFPRYVKVNGELQSGDYSIRENDSIEVVNHYTLVELLKLLDIDYESKYILVNNKEAKEEDIVYENFSVDFENRVVITEPEIEKTSYTEVNHEETNNVGMYNSQTNYSETDGEEPPEEAVNQNGAKDSLNVSKVSQNNNDAKDIFIAVNGQVVTLKGKDSYIFVDILDFYHFDTRVSGGKELKIKINGEDCEFTSPLKDGDVTEIYWVK